MKMLTKELAKQLPPLYTNETLPSEDQIAIVKFFDPCSNWTWYATEYDPQDRLFFGWVVGFEKEWGYFSLDELEQTKNRLGLHLERDLYFKPTAMKNLPGYK